MKNKFTKLVSLFMSAVMTISALSLSGFISYAETGDSPEQAVEETSDNELEYGGLFGKMFSDEIGESQKGTKRKQEEKYAVYRMYHEYLEPFLGVEYSAVEDCTLFVGFYNDEGTELLFSQTNKLQKSDNGYVELIINDVLPESYLIKSFIVGDELCEPLSSPCTYDKCTKRIQEILNKTTDDFDDENVVNFNNDKTDNFLVTKDGIVSITSTLEKDTYVEGDGSETYKFTNPDKVSDLKIGDKALIIAPFTALCFEVLDIKKSADSVVITPKDIDVNTAIDMIKYNTETLGDVYYEKLETEENDDVKYVGSDLDAENTENPSDTSVLRLPHVTPLSDKKFHFSRSLTFDLKKGSKKNISVAGQVTLFVNFECEVYYNNTDDRDLSLYCGVEFGLKFSIKGELEIEVELPEFKCGFLFNVFIRPVAVASVSAAFNWTVSKTIDIVYDGELQFKPREVDETYLDKPEIEIEASLSCKFQLGVELIDADWISADIAPEIGIRLTLTNSDSYYPPDVQHDCKNCLSLVIQPFIAAKAEFNFFGYDAEAVLAEASFDLLEYHNSNHSGWVEGPCDNISHKITLHIIEEKENEDDREVPIEGAKAFLAGLSIKDPETQEALKSDSNGNLSYFEKDKNILKRNYEVTVQSESGTKFGRCNVGKMFSAVNLSKNVFTVELSDSNNSKYIIEDDPNYGVCGHIDDEPSAWFRVYGDDTCYIWGSGVLDDIYQIPPTVKRIIITGQSLSLTEKEADGTPGINMCYFNNTNAKDVDLSGMKFKELPRSSFSYSSVEHVVLPVFTDTIGNSAFLECSELKNFDLRGICLLDEAAFRASGLTQLNCPSSLKAIAAHAFFNCKDLKNVTFDTNLKHIGICAFMGSGIQSLYIPSSVTQIGYNAFEECKNLRTVTINSDFTVPKDISSHFIITKDSDTLYKNFTYMGTFDEDDASWSIFKNCDNLRQVIINDGVTKINPGLFATNNSVSNVLLPGTLKTIGQNAFSDTSISKIKLPSGLVSIGESAFAGTRLVDVNIPASVTSIGVSAFLDGYDDDNKTYLKTITINNPECEISSSIVRKGEDVIIYGHDGSTAEAFAKTNGNTFISIDKPQTTKPAATTTTKTTTVTTTATITVTTVVSTIIGPDKECLFIAVRDPATATEADSDRLLDVDNVAYIDQQTADEKGKVTFSFIPDAVKDLAYMFISELNNSRVYKTVVDGTTVKTTWIDPKVTVLGDANNDGVVELADAILIMQHLSNPDKYSLHGSSPYHITEQGMINGDVYEHGFGLTSNDALCIQKYLLKLNPTVYER